MCGLFGAWGWPKLDTKAALKALSDRGPDGEGMFQDPCGLTMLHTRLAIQDLSALGHQPMLSEDNSLALVFNGEIYNQKSLREELETNGYTFKSHSDTEVLLHGFRHWKQTLWGKLEGIFAVACWESQKRQLTLARDRFGVKPLLWGKSEKRVVFASELSALTASGCCSLNSLNREAIESYLALGVCCSTAHNARKYSGFSSWPLGQLPAGSPGTSNASAHLGYRSSIASLTWTRQLNAPRSLCNRRFNARVLVIVMLVSS